MQLSLAGMVLGTIPTTASPQATSAPTQAAKATQAAPTATPLTTITENTPVLGGSIFAFDNKLGASNCCNRNGWDVNHMWVGIYTAEDGGSLSIDEQSHNRVIGIFIHPYNDINQTGTPTWKDLQTAKQICTVYLPPDAKLQSSQTSTYNNGLTTANINTYYSPTLATPYRAVISPMSKTRRENPASSL
jgi:hypothetical protein